MTPPSPTPPTQPTPCHNCGWLKNFITGQQLGGDPRLQHNRPHPTRRETPSLTPTGATPTMPTGYASWFETHYAKLSTEANSCTLCQQSLCQPADHFENFHNLLNKHSIRQAEHPDFGALFQFKDGTILQQDDGSLITATITNPTQLQAANAALNNDWHNTHIPQPDYKPQKVRTRTRRNRA